MKEKSNLSACRRRWGWGNDAQGKAHSDLPLSLEIAPRFPHSLGDCYTHSKFRLGKELSRAAFPRASRLILRLEKAVCRSDTPYCWRACSTAQRRRSAACDNGDLTWLSGAVITSRRCGQRLINLIRDGMRFA